MEGGDPTQPDWDFLVKIPEVQNAGMGVVDSFSSRWTDEKHNLYLSSIEEKFVHQLYGSKHLSSDLLHRLASTQTKANPSHLNSSKQQQSGQFKVMCQGSWKNLKFERSSKAIENDSCTLLTNTWVQHFKSPPFSKYPQASVNMDNNGLSCQSIKLNSHMEAKKTGSKRLPVCHLLSYPQDPVNNRAELSDQNFVDTEHYELGRESGKGSGKKRSRRTSHTKIIDQVVPCSSFSVSSSNSGSSSKGKDEEINNAIKRQQVGFEGLGFTVGELRRRNSSGGENISGG